MKFIQDKVELRPYRLRELAQLYKVDRRTFQKWLIPLEKKIKKREGQFYTTAQVRLIFKHLDLPGVLVLDTIE